VDGTLIQAWASMKSFVAKEAAAPEAGGSGPPPSPAQEAGTNANEEPQRDDSTKPAKPEDTAPMQSRDSDKKSRNEAVDLHGTKRSNATHASTTDPEARLCRKGKGKEARLCFMGHALAENRHGLIVEAALTQATGTAERDAAKAMIESHCPGSERRLTVGTDKAYDSAAFVADLRRMCVTPHVAQNTGARASAIDARTTRHQGYAVSQRRRKLIEEAFGWAKSIGGLARPMRQGAARMAFAAFTFAMAVYDLVRLPRLMAQAAA
jgi:hypothetical protein